MTATDNDIIVAIELGSTRIAGIAGRKKNGTMNVLAFAENNTMDGIKRGLIFNVEKTCQGIISVISDLEKTLNTKITRAYVGLGGQSVRSYKCLVKRNMLTQSLITNEAIDAMKDESHEIPFADCDVLENFPQEYTIDQNITTEPVGVSGTNIEGEFLNIIARTELKAKVDVCFAKAKLEIADELLAPYYLARNVLIDGERRSGCVLIDLGAQTTTVVVYTKNIIRHLVTIPLGSNNINQDLMNLKIDENEAEAIKLKFGATNPEEQGDTDNKETKTYTTSDGRNIEVNKILNIIHARLSEIVDNVRYQIEKSNYEDKLLAGIVLTGGGANMKNIDKVFLDNISKVDKIRIAKNINEPIVKDSAASNFDTQNTRNNTLLSLLLSGTISCASDADAAADKETQEEIQRQEDEEKKKKDAELKVVNKLETIKTTLRTKYDEVVKAKEKLASDGKSKKVRKACTEVALTALDPIDDEYQQCAEALNGKPQYKQTLREATEIAAKLKLEVNALSDAIMKANNENSFIGKFKKTMYDILNDNE